MTNLQGENLQIEKIFLEWKDEEMLAWDKFIYNMKLYPREIIISAPKTIESIINDFKVNFDIDITLEILKERTYLVQFFDKDISFYPSNEDLEKFLLYDMKILQRLSDATGLNIIIIFTDILRGKIIKTDVELLNYYEYERERSLYEMMNLYDFRIIDSINTELVNEYLEGTEDHLSVRFYDFNLDDERIKSLYIAWITQPMATFPPNLVSLTVETGIRNCILPESLKYLDCGEIISTKLPEGLISFKCNLLEELSGDFKDIEVPGGLIKLRINFLDAISNPADLKQLRYLEIEIMESYERKSRDFPELRFLITNEITDNLECPKLECLIVSKGHIYMLDRFPNLKILHTKYMPIMSQIPNVELLWINEYYIDFEPIPESVKYLISEGFDIISGNYTYLECESIDAENIKGLRMAISQTVKNINDDVIYYTSNKPNDESDDDELPF